jgi:hypothetical protein
MEIMRWKGISKEFKEVKTRRRGGRGRRCGER